MTIQAEYTLYSREIQYSLPRVVNKKTTLFERAGRRLRHTSGLLLLAIDHAMAAYEADMDATIEKYQSEFSEKELSDIKDSLDSISVFYYTAVPALERLYRLLVKTDRVAFLLLAFHLTGRAGSKQIYYALNRQLRKKWFAMLRRITYISDKP